MLGKPRKVDSPKKRKVEKPQHGRQTSGQNIGNPYQIEDNNGAFGAAPLGFVVFDLVRISYVLA